VAYRSAPRSAAAAIMGDTYPDLFAAIGVHSGLACGSARGMPSAFAPPQRGSDGIARFRMSLRIVPAIVFHADRDTVVNPRNGAAPEGQ
jgi:poly(3-hydroxybutyrate) depolymerase